MDEGPDFDAAFAAVSGLRPEFRALENAELLDSVESIEAIGRAIDALRVTVAAEVRKRAEKRRGAASLAFRNDARDGAELLGLTGRMSHRTAKQRIGLGAALASGRYGTIAEAVTAGDVGLDSARVVVSLLQSVRKRVIARLGKPDALQALAAAEAVLTDLARLEPPAQLRIYADRWRDVLDPDGAEAATDAGMRARALRLGMLRSDGTAVFSGVLATPEDYAMFKELLDSRRRRPMVPTPDGGDDEGEHEDLESEWRAEGDDRSRAQQDVDTMMEAIRHTVASEAAGAAPARVPHEIVVVATADQVANRDGSGWVDGILGRLSIPTIETIACEAGIRFLITEADGEPLHLGRSKRLFTAAQRKALLARSHGRCEIGLCTTPSPHLHAHHVRWHGRDDGPTDIDNAVMVCNHHHHLIHSDDPPFRLERVATGIVAIPRGWTGPPAARHRLREHRWARAA